MYTQLVKLLGMVVACIIAISPQAETAQQSSTRSGDQTATTVTFIDAKTGLLWGQGHDGKTIKLAAPTALLDDLQKGDRIQIQITPQAHPKAPQADTSRATVQKVDAETGLLRLQTMNGEMIDLEPFQTLAPGLQAGDEVYVAVYKSQ